MSSTFLKAKTTADHPRSRPGRKLVTRLDTTQDCVLLTTVYIYSILLECLSFLVSDILVHFMHCSDPWYWNIVLCLDAMNPEVILHSLGCLYQGCPTRFLEIHNLVDFHFESNLAQPILLISNSTSSRTVEWGAPCYGCRENQQHGRSPGTWLHSHALYTVCTRITQ